MGSLPSLELSVVFLDSWPVSPSHPSSCLCCVHLFPLWWWLFVMWVLEMRLSSVNHVSSPFVPISPTKQLRHKSVTCHTTLLENWNEPGGAECTRPGLTRCGACNGHVGSPARAAEVQVMNSQGSCAQVPLSGGCPFPHPLPRSHPAAEPCEVTHTYLSISWLLFPRYPPGSSLGKAVVTFYPLT